MFQLIVWIIYPYFAIWGGGQTFCEIYSPTEVMRNVRMLYVFPKTVRFIPLK